MLRQRLQQKLLQKLSPQQIQMIKLLEVPTLHIEERIKKELEDNPALEEGMEEEAIITTSEEEEERIEEVDRDREEFTIDDYIDDDETPEYRLQSNNYSKDDKRTEIPFSVGSSFHEHLESQLGLRYLTDKQKILGEYILGNIDEDGYLRRELENIVDDLAFLQNVDTTEEEIEEVLAIIQDLEPVGVGARTLQECLLIQLRKRDTTDPNIANAIKILSSCFEEFSKRHYDKIIAKLELDEAGLKSAIEEILKLNPKPGGGYNDPYNRSVQHIIPDFILEPTEEGFELHLNSRNMPELRLNAKYNEMLKTYSAADSGNKKEMREAVQFVKQKIDSARWFIDAIKQRQNTLLLTMNAILNYQNDYFVEGDETKLRPMVLKDVAEMTGLDISTVSRVANSKYIQTHFGMLPLKYFFSEGLQTDSGEEVSTREIKKILEECVNGEDKRKPLTDEKLTNILQEKGYQIARRTVAKYREQLNIPVARLRKEI
ncbi:MAG: RNA polymerase factor sigma-54 [Bacteroidales bacterium]|jgi:RNA polymerase sigma-54 factor